MVRPNVFDNRQIASAALTGKYMPFVPAATRPSRAASTLLPSPIA